MIETRFRRTCASSLLPILLLSTIILTANGPSLAQQTQGARVDDDQVVVDFDSHWRNWNRPTYLTVVEDGAVRSRHFRGVSDVLSDRSFTRSVIVTRPLPRIANMDSTRLLDALGQPATDRNDDPIYSYFVRPGISRVGSNSHLADNIFDGVDTTYWEPNFDDPPENWWIEVDLGRPVAVERVRLDFAEEGDGDPFFRFVMLVSEEQTLFRDEGSGINSNVFIPFEGINTDQRVFVFDSSRLGGALPLEAMTVEPESNTFAVEDSDAPAGAYNGNPTADVEWTGRMLETIRIFVSSSRMGRAQQISEEEWQALPVDDRGDIVYFLRDGDFEEPVEDEATYLKLAQDRRGRLEYYRRERPRLAEIKVWGWGDEVGIQLAAGGGSIASTFPGDETQYFDGNWASENVMDAIIPERPGSNVLTLDLGGILWMQQVRMATRGAPRGHILRGSTGTLDAQGEKQWTVLSTPDHEINIDTGFHRFLVNQFTPLQRVRFFELFFLAHSTEGETTDRFSPRIREIFLYPGAAPPAEVVLESPPIDVQGLFNLGGVHWEAQTPPGSDVEIRTRTGDQLVEVTRYYDKAGNEVTGKDEEAKINNYNRLRSFKGPIITSLEIGSGWNPWSQRYSVSGELATSPGLRSQLQIQARLINHDQETVPVLEKIIVDLEQPLAHGLGAEVWPALTLPGRLDTFEVFLQPDFLQRPEVSPGIDEIRLRSDPPIDLRMVDLAVGTEAELGADQPVQLFDRWFVEDGRSMLLDAASASPDTLQVMSQGDSLWLVLPEVLESTPAALLQRSYFRLVSPGDDENPADEVPTDLSGTLLTFYSHSALRDEERGQVIHFRQVGEGDALTDDDVVTAAEYEELPDEEKGPIRYFRKVSSVGNQSAYDELGNLLVSQYPRSRERGWEIGPGRLVRLRFTSEVYLPTTVLNVAVRNSGVEAAWQVAREQDVTELRPAQTLVIRAPQPTGVIDDVAIAPNPFTPNDDGVNDLAQIDFSLFRVFDERPIALRIYTLGGHLLWQQEKEFLGGRQTMEWNGMDMNGHLVPPGLYLCQLEALADADVDGLKQTRVIAVAY